jgi:hypothetical protein
VLLPRTKILGLGVSLVALGSAGAFGQLATAARVSRPSDQGPSVIVGQVGGGNTRYGSNAQTQAQIRFDYQNAGIGAFGGGGLSGSGQRSRLYSGPPINAFGRRGQRSGSAIYGANTSPFGMGDTFVASGMEEATSYEMPLIGWESARIDSGNSAVYVAPSDATAFHNFFGLTPSREAPPVDTSTDQLQSELIGRINDRDINDLLEKGKREFTLGTTVGRPDRNEHLAVAQDCFSGARHLDHKGWLPALLSVSVALERNRVESAIQALEEAVTRNARALAERPDVVALYGSREQFDATARLYYQIGTQSSEDSKQVIIEAYFALLAGDKSRADAALRRAEDANRMLGLELHDRICRSMRIALQ